MAHCVEKVTIATCDMRPPHVAPIFFRFKYNIYIYLLKSLKFLVISWNYFFTRAFHEITKFVKFQPQIWNCYKLFPRFPNLYVILSEDGLIVIHVAKFSEFVI